MVKPLTFDHLAQIPGAEEGLFDRLAEWEGRVKEKYQMYMDSGLIDDENFEAVTSKQINLREMLSKIPLEERRRLMYGHTGDPLRPSYAEIIGLHEKLDGLTATTAPEHLSELTGSARSKAWRFNINPEELMGNKTNAWAIIYQGLFPNLDLTDPNAEAKIGMNILSSDYLKKMTELHRKGALLESGKKVLVFDTETAGLIESSGVRQVSSKLMDTSLDHTGQITFTDVADSEFNQYFDTARMHLGFLGDEGHAIPMTKWLENHGMSPEGKMMGQGTEFANAMKPFLEQVKQADYFVGHNVHFDIDQIFGNLRRTAAYKDNINGFGTLMDEATEKLFNQGIIVDTLHMARSALPDLPVDPLLNAISSSASQHSISNLMLQSNLYELLRDEHLGMGPRIDELLQTGQHAAEVDKEITAHALKFMNWGMLDVREHDLPEFVKRATYKASAPTPVTKIRDYQQLDRGILDDLLHEARAHVADARETPNYGVKFFDEDGTDITGDHLSKSADEIHAMLTGPDAPMGVKFDVNPIEQEIWKTRKLGTPPPGEVTDRSILESIGDWRRYTGQDVRDEGWLNKAADLFKRGKPPTHEAFTKLQERMLQNGMPFAELSRPERWLSVGLAQAAFHRSDVNKLIAKGGVEEQRLMQYGSNLGISRFAAQKDIYMTDAAGRNISLPTEIIQAAEEATHADGGTVLSSNLSKKADRELEELGLSAFETKSGKARVHLTYQFKSKEEAERLRDWLKTVDFQKDKLFGGKSLSEFGGIFNWDELLKELPESGVRHGIGVGYMNDRAGRYAHGIIQSLTGDIMRDDEVIRLRAGVSDIKDGVIKMGAFYLDRFGQDRKARYAQDMARAGEVEGRLSGIVGKASGAARAWTYYTTPEGALPVVEKTWEIYDKLRANKLAVGGIAIGAAALWMFKKHKDKVDPAMETIDQMPNEGRDDYYNYRQGLDLPSAPARRAPDPLLTAGVVGNLDRNKIGHTKMGAQNRYQNLYSGVY